VPCRAGTCGVALVARVVLNVVLAAQHETVIETEAERVADGRPVGDAYLPLAEAPEIHDLVFNRDGPANTGKRRPRCVQYVPHVTRHRLLHWLCALSSGCTAASLNVASRTWQTAVPLTSARRETHTLTVVAVVVVVPGAEHAPRGKLASPRAPATPHPRLAAPLALHRS